MKANTQNWKQTKLKELCREITVGHVGPMATEYTESGVPFLRSQNILPFQLDLSSIKFISPEFHNKLKKSSLQPGDVVVVRTGYPGTACVIPSNLPISNCADLVIIRPSSQLDSYYLAYVFNSASGRSHVASSLVGVAQQHFNIGVAREMMINLPPLPTQRKIAAILSAYDDLIENNTRRIAILEDMAQSLYREWFVHFRFPGHEKKGMVESPLGLIPEGWEVVKLGEVLTLQRGFDLPVPQRQEGNIPVYAATGINGTHNAAKVKGPGVLTGRSGSLGTIIYVHEDFWPLNTTLWVKEFHLVTPIYAFYLLSTLELTTLNAGAAVPTLNRNDVHKLPIIIPARTIIEKFDTYVFSLFETKKILTQENANLRKTRDLLLPKLISGEIDVERVEVEVDAKAVEV